MNKLSRILLIICILLTVILTIMTYYCMEYKNAFEIAINRTMEITEKNSQLEKDFGWNMENVSIEVMPESISSSGVTIIITDNNEIPYIWKENYTIEIKEDDSWKELKMLSEANFNETVYKVDENNKIEQKIDWNNIYGIVSNGTYRIVKHVSTPIADLYFESNEFEIK